MKRIFCPACNIQVVTPRFANFCRKCGVALKPPPWSFSLDRDGHDSILVEDITQAEADKLWSDHKPDFVKALRQERYAEMVIRHGEKMTKHIHSSDFIHQDGLWYEVSDLQ